MMNQSKQLKIWTLVTHALILIGAGHGMGPLVVFEALGLIKPFMEGFFEDKLAQALFLFSVLIFVGQVLIIFSIYSKIGFRKGLHIVGLFLLSTGTLYIGFVIYFDPYSLVLYVTCLPFVICVFLTMFGKHFHNFIRRASEDTQ